MKKTPSHLAIISLIGFSITLIIHLLTFVGVGLFAITSQLAVVMFIGAFGVFVLMAFGSLNLNLDYSRSYEAYQNNWRKILAPIPIWGQRLITICGIYVFINFNLTFMVGPIGLGQVISENGRYYLKADSKIVRELSVDEYHRHQIYVIRGWSGHLMIFYLLPGLFFLYHTSPPHRKR
jgi:dolichyl-phosphate-mannose--protein O-mannosyl transferase